MLRIKTLSLKPAAANIALKMGLALILVSIVGCPNGLPSLSVTPNVFSFSVTSTQATMSIGNTGGGTLNWEIQNLPAWLSASPMSGSVTNESQGSVLSADFSSLTAGSHSSVITVTSNGGDREVMVTATVVAPPILDVSPLSVDFGSASIEETFSINNPGSSPLTWTIAESLPEFFSVDVSEGTINAGGIRLVLVTFDRDNATLGSHSGTISITSSGGSASIALSASVQALSVSPPFLNFGTELNQLPFSLENLGTDPIDWTVNVGSLPSWATLVAEQASGTLAIGEEQTFGIAIDRSGFSPGEIQDSFTISSNSGNAEIALRVEELPPLLTVSPTSLDFGSSTTTDTLSILNDGSGILSWAIEEGQVLGGVWTAGDLPWLAIQGLTSGTLMGNETTPLTLVVDRSQVTPDADTPFQGVLRVSSLDGQEQFVSVLQMTIPPTLRVLPQNLDFGTSYASKQLAIWNAGLGTVNWQIDTSGMPAWLTLPDADANGIVSGTVTGDQTNAVEVLVDRAGLEAQEDLYRWTFPVTAVDETNFPLEPVTISVTISVPKFPVIVLDTDAVDEDGIAFVAFGAIMDEVTFSIENLGTVPLSWTIDMTTLPAWVVSIEPSQYVLPAGESIIVTANIDREGFPSGDYIETFTIISNDPDNGTLPVRFEMLVPKKLSIGIHRAKLALGLDSITDFFEVANMGDPGTILNFQVESNKNWLFFYPETGQSTGTANILKDWRMVNISIDRSRLDEPTGGVGELKIWAFEIDEFGERVPIPTIEPKYVTVSVEASPLTFEGARGRLRVPSLVRFVSMMRDLAYRIIPLSHDLYDLFTNSFGIFEQEIQLDPDETNQFLTSGEHLRTNVAILLDYSNSMYLAAQLVSDPAIANDPDPLQALYNQCVGSIIDELPASYSVGLFEFHERNQPTHAAPRDDGGPLFISDKAILHSRLESISITDHGASDLLMATTLTGLALYNEDAQDLATPFDDADVQALICITDGRYTTAPAQAVNETRDFLNDLGIRFFPIGWGSSVLSEPLARISAGTGGHYYSIAFDPDGLPSVSNLWQWCYTSDPAVDPCDQSIAKDLRSQVVLSYVTLAEFSPVTVRVDATLGNPNDGVCLPQLGTITGGFEQKNFNMVSVVGDVRLGQISLRTDGILSGQARVVIRADYIPRNNELFSGSGTYPFDTLEFQITTPEAFTVSAVPDADGGIVEGWTITDLGGGLISITRPAPLAPFRYGEFGDMLYLDFATPSSDPFFIDFGVADPIIDFSDPNSKYFCHPNRITVGTADDYFASALPHPSLQVTWPPTGDPNWMHLTPENPVGQIEVRNTGGNHTPTGVWLEWECLEAPDYISSITPQEGIIDNNQDVDVVTVSLNMFAPAGDYDNDLWFLINSGSLYYSPREIFTTIHVTAWIPDLEILQQPLGDTRLIGERYTFSVVASGESGPLSYQWCKDGIGPVSYLPGQNSSTLTLTNLDLNDTGYYYVWIGDQYHPPVEMVLSDAALLVVMLIPIDFTLQPVGATKVVGENHTFSATATGGTGTLTYQWQKDGKDLAGETGTTLTLTNLQITDSGDYQMMVGDDNRPSQGALVPSAIATLTVTSP